MIYLYGVKTRLKFSKCVCLLPSENKTSNRIKTLDDWPFKSTSNIIPLIALDQNKLIHHYQIIRGLGFEILPLEVTVVCLLLRICSSSPSELKSELFSVNERGLFRRVDLLFGLLFSLPEELLSLSASL